MKEESIGKMKKIPLTFKKGMSTLEILLAFAILILTITAVLQIGFGSQSITVDSEINTEALSKAQAQLEDARAESRKDFFTVVSANSSDSIYSKKLLIEDISSCSKKATSTVEWSVSGLREQKIELVSIFNDITTALGLGGDCVDTPNPEDEWDNPSSYSQIDLTPSGSKATDIDTVKINNIPYVFLSAQSANESDDDLYVVDVSDPQNPIVVTSKKYGGCLSAPGFPKRCGFNTLDVAGNYIYLANASSTDLESSDEIKIVDISNPENPVLRSTVDLNISPTCSGGGGSAFCPGGAFAVKYFNKKLYIGTHRINGEEFQVWDVSDPASPAKLNGIDIDRNVNDIDIKNDYAYLATSNASAEVDIRNISTLAQAGSFDATGDEDGREIFIAGNLLYLGRDRTPNTGPNPRKDFYVLSISNPISPIIKDAENIGMSNNNFVAGISITGKFAFLALSDQTKGFEVWNISDPSNIVLNSTCSTYNYSEKATGIDFINGYVFVSNESQNALRVIYDQLNLCTP